MTKSCQPNVPAIDPSRCAGCGRCVAACRKRLISLDVAGYRKHGVIAAPDLCDGCGACIGSCPVEAVSSGE